MIFRTSWSKNGSTSWKKNWYSNSSWNKTWFWNSSRIWQFISKWTISRTGSLTRSSCFCSHVSDSYYNSGEARDLFGYQE
jgi:hypothetical protein